jgi:hypothetical protein
MERAIAGVYQGPLEEFVQRRDTLVKDLRSAGDREAAAAVKALRKPSRAAWALNMVAVQGETTMRRLDAAIEQTLQAQTSGGDVRAAAAQLRESVDAFGTAAALVAERAGYPLEPAGLASAVLAVLGRQDSFRDLRRGLLAEVPEGGGLDFLATLPTVLPRPNAEPPATSENASREIASRAAAQAAAQALATARARSELAQGALRQAGKALRAAEEEYHRAKQDAESASAQLAAAERAAAEGAHGVVHDADWEHP